MRRALKAPEASFNGSGATTARRTLKEEETIRLSLQFLERKS
jgi:hypothetical protein